MPSSIVFISISWPFILVKELKEFSCYFFGGGGFLGGLGLSLGDLVFKFSWLLSFWNFGFLFLCGVTLMVFLAVKFLSGCSALLLVVGGGTLIFAWWM